MTPYPQALFDIGYLGKILLVCGTDHGSSTKRKRGFAIAVEINDSGIGAKEGRRLLNLVEATLNTLKIGAGPPFEEMMIPSDSAHLQEVFDVLSSGAKKPKPDTDWQGRFVAQLHQKSLTWAQVMPPDWIQASPWYPWLPGREKMNLGYAVTTMPEVRAVELSQMPGVGACSKDDALNALLPGSKVQHKI